MVTRSCYRTGPSRVDEYAARAAFYDPFTAPFLGALRRDMAALAAGLGPGPVLDVCCGTGAQLALLAEKAAPAFGTDLSGPMLVRAAKRAPGRVVLADAAHLPLRDGCAPVCLLTLALHEKPWDTALAIVTQMLRVAGPDGALLLADFCTPQGPAGRAAGLVVALIERLAGREHAACCRTFLDRGGLEGFLCSHGRLRYTIQGRRFGVIALAEVRAA